jgi:actin-like ATPase involved in cell morphogenesis
MIIFGDRKKKMASIVVGSAFGESAKENNAEEYKERAKELEGENEMHVCANEIMKAIKQGDVKMLKDCLMTFFELADSQPHLEGKHEDIYPE